MEAELPKLTKFASDTTVKQIIELIEKHLKDTENTDILSEIDKLCRKIIGRPRAKVPRQLLKTSNAIRSLVSRSMGTVRLAKSPVVSVPPNSAPPGRRPSHSSVSTLSRSTQPASQVGSRAPELRPEPQSFEAINERPVYPTIMRCALFGAGLADQLEGHKLVQMPVMTDSVAAKIHVVAEAKLEAVDARDAPRRRGCPAVRPYVEQVPLVLDSGTMDTVIAALGKRVGTGPGEADPEQHLYSTQILIKLMIDALLTEDDLGPLMLLLEALLRSDPPEARCHVFTLLLNLATHCRLVDPDPAHPGPLTDAALAKTRRLFVHALFLIDIADEPNPDVWRAALAVYGRLFTAHGGPSPHSDGLVPPRLIVRLLDHSPAPIVADGLIQAIVRQLYSPSGTLDPALVVQVGGPGRLVDLYLRSANSASVTVDTVYSLFSVLIDVIVYTMAHTTSATPIVLDEQTVDSLRTLLAHVHFPELAHLALAVPSTVMVDSFVSFVYTDLARSDTAVRSLIGRVPRRTATHFMGALCSMAHRFTVLNEKVRGMIEAALDSGDPKAVDAVRRAVRGLLSSTGSHEDGGTLAFLRAVRAVLALYRSRMGARSLVATAAAQSTRTAQAFDLLNDCCQAVIKVPEAAKDQAVLAAIGQLIVDWTLVRQVGGAPHPPRPLVAMFVAPRSTLERVVAIPSLVQAASPALYRHLFLNLDSAAHPHLRQTMFAFLDACYRQSHGASAMPFYKALLKDKQPTVAYHAAQRILAQLRAANPVAFEGVFKEVVRQAQRRNDSRLLANEYLQLHAVFAVMQKQSQQK